MSNIVMTTEDHGLKPDRRGKVRDIFDLEDRLLIVSTDRVSAYDVILPDPLPGKGVVLTQMTLGWYRHFGGDLKTHFITSDHNAYPEPFKGMPQLAGRSMLVRKADRFDVECVVRGYLAGSGWKEYQENRAVCGERLPGGLVEASRLEEPIFTPATKADSGHDENISFERMTDIVPAGIARTLREMSIDIYKKAHEHAKSRGIILADTKFEFGQIQGEIILIDEMLSPDSSRFWPAHDYQPGRPQLSFDKQFVRDYLNEIGWDRTPPAPSLPDRIIEKTVERYHEACRCLFPDIDLEMYL